MPRRIFPVDWRNQFHTLEPFLNGNEGVVRVRYSGNRCAPNAFLETLKNEYECNNDNQHFRSVRIDREVYSVHYLSGIRREFIRKMQISLPDADGMTAGLANIASDNIAGGDQTIHTETHFHRESPAMLERNRDHWIHDLCTQLSDFLSGGARLMVVVNHGTVEDQDEFWRFLWHNRLETLADPGVFLVQMADDSKGLVDLHYLAPQPHSELFLPPSLDDVQQAHAVDDIKEILLRVFPYIPEEVAHARADTLVHDHAEDVGRLHDKLAGLLVRLEREAN